MSRALKVSPIVDLGFDGNSSASSSSWWTAGGASNVLWAYQSINVSTYGESLKDLSGNGHTITGGVQPDWSIERGWIFDGATNYLIAPSAVESNRGDRTLIMRYSNFLGTGTAQINVGWYGGANTQRLNYSLFASSGGMTYGNGNFFHDTGHTFEEMQGNVMGIVGYDAYRNTTLRGTIPSGAVTSGLFYIGALNINGSPFWGFEDNSLDILALAYYDVKLSVAEYTAVANEMAGL